MKNKHVFDELIGKRVSVLFDHPKPKSKLNESYVGVLIGRKDGFLCMSFAIEGNRLDYIYMREDKVLSIWVYNDQGEQGLERKF